MNETNLTVLTKTRAVLYNFIMLIGHLNMKAKDVQFQNTEEDLLSTGVPNVISDSLKNTGKSNRKNNGNGPLNTLETHLESDNESGEEAVALELSMY